MASASLFPTPFVGFENFTRSPLTETDMSKDTSLPSDAFGVETISALSCG